MTGLRHLRCKTHYWPLDEEHTPHTPGHVLEKTAPDDSCESISDVSGDLLLAAVAPEGGVWLHLSLHHPRALHLLPRTSHLVSGIHNIHTTRTTHRSKHMGMLVDCVIIAHALEQNLARQLELATFSANLLTIVLSLFLCFAVNMCLRPWS